jgi:hypothetical protein
MQLKDYQLIDQIITPDSCDPSYSPVSGSYLTGKVSILSEYKSPGFTEYGISLVFEVRLSTVNLVWIWGLA